MVKKVVVTGPECSGKTTLSSDLSSIYNSTFINEYSREYLEKLKRPYTEKDLITIALGQYKREKNALRNHAAPLICDTSLLVIKIWSQVKYGAVHPLILDLLEKAKPDLYILPDFDIPYEKDPLRENPNNRSELYELYKEELSKIGVEWIIVSGDRITRTEKASNAINSLLSSIT